MEDNPITPAMIAEAKRRYGRWALGEQHQHGRGVIYLLKGEARFVAIEAFAAEVFKSGQGADVLQQITSYDPKRQIVALFWLNDDRQAFATIDIK